MILGIYAALGVFLLMASRCFRPIADI